MIREAGNRRRNTEESEIKSPSELLAAQMQIAKRFTFF